jgi:predicted nucleic acid-binding protein
LKKSKFSKIILIDTNVLIVYIANTSNEITSDDKERLDYFFKCVEKYKSKIIIPMPAVAEFLVKADHASIESLNKLEKKKYILLAPFDRAAAFECAQLDRAALGTGNKKDGAIEDWQKIKVDRQIVAIGKSQGVSLIITEDNGVKNSALRVGIEAKAINDLELPASARQEKLPLVLVKK